MENYAIVRAALPRRGPVCAVVWRLSGLDLSRSGVALTAATPPFTTIRRPGRATAIRGFAAGEHLGCWWVRLLTFAVACRDHDVEKCDQGDDSCGHLDNCEPHHDDSLRSRELSPLCLDSQGEAIRQMRGAPGPLVLGDWALEPVRGAVGHIPARCVNIDNDDGGEGGSPVRRGSDDGLHDERPGECGTLVPTGGARAAAGWE